MMDRVTRTGTTVRRRMEYWSPAVHDLLRYLQSVDFPAPCVLNTEDGVETLTWIEGESGPDGWAKVVPEPGLRRWARFLRDYHDAVAGYRPPADSVWSSGARGCSPGDIICHGDFGPWNSVWRGGDVVGLIDWDHARPARPLFDVAYGLEYAAPFRDDEECVRWLRYPGPPNRRRRIEVFCDAYGIPVPDDVSACVAEVQRIVAANCEANARRGIEPQATWVREGYLGECKARIAWTESSGL
jgi:aminoglycoside phosphotransferase (APT) family kinase protein